MRAVVIPPLPSAAALVAVLEGVLDGREPGILPLPADEREAELLATSLRVGEEVDDVAVVMSTSGTTGIPKGALLTAPALVASADATNERLGGPGTWLLALPAHHVAGLQVLVRSVISGTLPAVVDPSFTSAELCDAVDAMGGSGPRYASLVAVQLDKALADARATAALASLDAVLIGGGPMPANVAEKARAAAIPVMRTYGMSETAGGCVYDGVPLTGVDVRIDGGRILLGGATLAKGYRNPVDPDPFVESGWFRTDDVGSVDDSGVLRVLGRADDAIGTGGLTVMPALVETALVGHPAIADCAVFGVPDDRLGQRVAVAVVLAAGATVPTAAELRDHVALTLAPTAGPREVHVVDELPRRGIGKVDRRELTARYAAEG